MGLYDSNNNPKPAVLNSVPAVSLPPKKEKTKEDNMTKAELHELQKAESEQMNGKRVLDIG